MLYYILRVKRVREHAAFLGTSPSRRYKCYVFLTKSRLYHIKTLLLSMRVYHINQIINMNSTQQLVVNEIANHHTSSNSKHCIHIATEEHNKDCE